MDRKWTLCAPRAFCFQITFNERISYGNQHFTALSCSFPIIYGNLEFAFFDDDNLVYIDGLGYSDVARPDSDSSQAVIDELRRILDLVSNQ